MAADSYGPEGFLVGSSTLPLEFSAPGPLPHEVQGGLPASPYFDLPSLTELLLLFLFPSGAGGDVDLGSHAEG